MSIYLIDFENVHDSGLNGISLLTENDEVNIFYSNKSEHMSFDTHVNIMKSVAKIKYIKLRKSAKNYLDFQLATHVGYLIGSQVEGPYYIISKDTGYDSVVDYWKEHGITVTRHPAISFSCTPKQVNPLPPVINSSLPMAASAAEAESTEETASESVQEILEIPEFSGEEAIPAVSVSEETVSEAEESVPLKPDTLPESYRKKVRTALKGKNIPSGNYSAIYKAIVNSYDKLALNNLLVKSFGSSKGGVVYNMIKDIFTDYHSA